MPSDVIPEKYFAYAKCYNTRTSCMPSVVIPEKYFAYAKCGIRSISSRVCTKYRVT
jgi:hypothetical protein